MVGGESSMNTWLLLQQLQEVVLHVDEQLVWFLVEGQLYGIVEMVTSMASARPGLTFKGSACCSKLQ